MKLYLLLIACGVSLTAMSQQKTGISRQKRDNESYRQLMRQDSLMMRQVDSLRNVAMSRNATIEKLQARLGVLKKNKAKVAARKMVPLKRKLTLERQQFDLDLTRLDSCTGILDNLHKKLDALNKKPRKS